MNHHIASHLAACALCASVFSACDKPAEREPEEEVEQAAEPSAFEADCTVTESSRSLGVIVMRDQDQRCTVFAPEPIDGGDYSVALRADSADRSIAAELIDEEGERLYATEGEVSIQAADGRITGHVDARDENAPAVGRVRIAIDAAMP